MKRKKLLLPIVIVLLILLLLGIFVNQNTMAYLDDPNAPNEVNSDLSGSQIESLDLASKGVQFQQTR